MPDIIKNKIIKSLAFIQILTCMIFLANVYGAYVQIKIVNAQVSLEKKGDLLLRSDLDNPDLDIHGKKVLSALDIINKNAVHVDMTVAKNAKVMICLQVFSLLLISFLFLHCWYRANKLLGN